MFDLGLESDVPLPELPRSSGAGALRVRARGNPPARRRWTWLEENRRADGAVWLAIGRHADDWLLRFPRLADFELRDGAGTIVARVRPGVPPRTFRHLLVDVVVPVALSARGHLLFHASAIAGPGGAALFVGPTGAGKSTLAASFDGRFRPFSDDAVRVVERSGVVYAVSAYGGTRLWPDALAAIGSARRTQLVAHYTTKRRVPGARIRSRQPLKAIYVLQRGAAASRVGIRGCSRRGGVVELLSHIYCLDSTDADMAKTHLDAVAALTSTVPVFTLTFPGDLGRLNDVRSAVVNHLGSIAPASHG